VPVRISRLLFLAFSAANCLLAGSVTAAAPASEISAAIQVAGSGSTETASKKTFLRAWSAVISGGNELSARAYVSAAVRLQPTFGPAIVQSTLSILIPPKKQVLTEKEHVIIRETVDGAVEVEPSMAAAIVLAALSVQPAARDEIVAAAIVAAPDQREAILAAAAPYALTLTWLRLSENGSEAPAAPVGAVNPSNIDARGDRDEKKVRSPEKKPKKPKNP
jgi:hypothetical protein